MNHLISSDLEKVRKNSYRRRNHKNRITAIICISVLLLSLLISGSGKANSSNDTYEELVSIIETSESITSSSDEEVIGLYKQDTENVKKYSDMANVFKEADEDIYILSEQAKQLSGPDIQIKSAITDYFKVIHGYLNEKYERYSFISKLYELDARATSVSKNSSLKEYYTNLNNWYIDNKKKFDSVTDVPASMETIWNKFKEIFELNDDIVNKYYYAQTYYDFLSYYSGINMSQRRDLLMLETWKNVASINNDNNKFSQKQLSVAKGIAEEIKYYSDLNDTAKEGYEFEYRKQNTITKEYSFVDTISPALYNTYDAFVIFQGGSLRGNNRITIETEIPGFTQLYKQTINLGPELQTIYIKPPALSGDIDLSKAKDAQINISLYSESGKLLDTNSHPVRIKSINDVEWYSDDFGEATKDNILCYLTPDADEIDVLTRNAIVEISNMTNGRVESLAGYQENKYNHYVNTYLQAAGIMRAMYDMGVRYSVGSFSVDNSNQRVKLPAEVLRKKSGLCIETALTVASALQSAGMHAFIIMPPGHAQVAVEIWDDGGEGTGEYFLIETTCLDKDSNNDDIYVSYMNGLLNNSPGDLKKNYPISYYSSEEWKQYIDKNDVYVIDCNDSRVLGLTPFYN